MSANVVVVGRLGADAEQRDAGNAKVLEFRMASDTKAKVAGEWSKITNWYRVSLFGDRGKLIDYLTKGTQVSVRGALLVREYQKDGTTRTSLDVRADDVELLGGGQDHVTQTGSKKPAGNNAPDPFVDDQNDQDPPF